MKRISDLEKWLASHDLPNGDDSLDTGKDVEICEIIDSGASDVTTLKSRLMYVNNSKNNLKNIYLVHIYICFTVIIVELELQESKI